MLPRASLPLLLAFGSCAAAACTCLHPSGDLEADVRYFWEPATAVVAAVVTSVDTSTTGSPGSPYRGEFQRALWQITRRWKGHHEVGDTLATEPRPLAVCAVRKCL